MLITELKNETTELFFQIISPTLKYSNDRIIFQAGAAAYNSTITPVGLAGWKWKGFYFSAGRSLEVIFTPIENFNTEVISYTMLAFNAGYENEKFLSNIELFQTQYAEGSNLGFRGKADVNLSWLSLRQTGGIYNLESGNSHTQPIDMYSYTTLIFSPNVWRWKTARYQPFIGV